MKRSFKMLRGILVGLILACSRTQAATATKYTANFYRLYAAEHLNQEIKLYVAFLGPIPGINPDEIPKGYQIYAAHTAYRGEYGEAIAVLIPDEQAKKMLKRFGTAFTHSGGKISSRKLEGVLKEFREEDGARDYYVIMPRDNDAGKPWAVQGEGGYPYIRDGRVYTGKGGVPVKDVIRMLKEAKELR